MNNFVFNNESEPLFISDSDSNQTLTSKGDIFTISKIDFSLLVDYDSIKIYNQPTYSKNIYLSDFSASSSVTGVKLFISFIKNGTHTSIGTITPINNNFTSTNTSVASVSYSNTSGTGTTSVYNAVQYQTFYNQPLNSTICIPPGSSLLIRFHKIDLIIGTLIFVLNWYEA